MPNDNKTQEFLQKLAPCIERGDLDACVEEAARLAQEIGVGAEEIFNLCINLGEEGKNNYAYVLALVAVDDIRSEDKAAAYCNLGLTAYNIGKIKFAEENYIKSLYLNPKLAITHNNYANLLRENAQYYEAEKEISIALQIEPKNPYALGTYGDILADEDYLEEALKKYHEAIKNSDSINNSEKAENHNNLGWVYANLEQYDRAKKKFEEAQKLDPQNVKVIRNIRALGKVKSEPKISKMQLYIAIALFAVVIATWYLFLTKELTENIFSAQTIILIAIIIFILFYHQLGKFKAGPIEFEKSTEHRSQPSEAISKIER